MNRIFHWRNLSLLAGLALTATLLLGGCSTDSYDNPTTASNVPVAGASTNVLIEPATLKAWIDQGLVNNENGFDQKVVILDFAPATDVTPRILGAHRVPQGDLQTKRFEGVGDASPMVGTGAQMDAVIQRLGIDDNTIIVFTTSQVPYYATRAYWTFRYWGFPKECLKFLNGGNTAFGTGYPELMSTEAQEKAGESKPTVTPSTYSVRNLAGVNDDLRASVGEMIEIVKTLPTSTTDVVLDARGIDPIPNDSKTYSGYYGTLSTPGAIVTGTTVVFDGHPVGGEYLNQSKLFNTDSITKISTFKPAADIKALFVTKGWKEGKKVTVYCTSGYSTSPLFFALDAILGGDVQLFDGSWSQLGNYSNNEDMGGKLPVNSLWAIDSFLDLSFLRYNKIKNANLKIESLVNPTDVVDPFIGDNPADDSDVNPDANQIEVADLAAVNDPAIPQVTFSVPVATATPNVLIEPTKLKEWMTADLVNKAQGSERVVIIDVTTEAAYKAGHIPGAQLWNTVGQAVTRTEGPADAVNMVLTPELMNTRLKALGIDEYTTIVITSSQTVSFQPSRAYFTFRYYGWPKERLKVLNGYNFAWAKSGLSTTATDLADSTLTVQQIGNLRTDLRASLPEMMDGIRDDRGIPVDMRGSAVAAAGSTTGVFDVPVPDDYVVFEGTMKGGKYYTYTDFQVNAANGDYRYKSAADISSALNLIGLDGSEVVYSMCRTAMIASAGFFVLDAILGWDVMVYDGSWSQWGSLSSVPATPADFDTGGQLTVGSLWAVDNTTYMDVINYNKNALNKIEPFTPDAAALLLKPSDAAANQIEKADKEYQAVPPAGGTTAPPTSGGGDAGGLC